VFPHDLHALPKVELAVELGTFQNVGIDDSELQLDYFLGGMLVYFAEHDRGFVALTTRYHDSRRLWEPVHEAELNDGRDDTQGDCGEGVGSAHIL
jgi:hypothetical protein